MTCEECERWQGSGQVAYIRVGAANVGLIGCPKHVGAVMTLINKRGDEIRKTLEVATQTELRDPVYMRDEAGIDMEDDGKK